MIIISVIIPVYNGQLFIEETIQSVIKQTFKDWELIVVNDGSTDKTSLILNKYSSSQNIKIIHKNNSGVSDSRNKGAEVAEGKYYCFLDADDLLVENCLERRFEKIKHAPNALFHNDIEEIDINGVRRNVIFSGISGMVLDKMLAWKDTTIPGPSSVILSKESFEEVKGFDTELSTAADQDFFIRLAEKHYVERIPEILTLYRIHPNNMHQNIPLMEKDHTLVFVKAAKNKLFKSYTFKQQCFANLYLILAGSWWKEGKNKSRALLFMFKSFLAYPLHFFKLFKKI